MAKEKSAPNPVLKRLVGTLLSLLVIVGGVSMIASPESWGPEGFTSESGRSKARMVKAALRWMFENIGQTPTGAIVAAGGALALFLVWKPVILRKKLGA